MNQTPAPPRSPDRTAPPAIGTIVTLHPRTRVWADGSVLLGGSPWRLSRLSPSVIDLVGRLLKAGPAGLPIESLTDRAATRVLHDRGFVVLRGPGPATNEWTVVMPAMDRLSALDRALESVAAHRVIVVDDGSTDPASLAAVVARHGAELIVHDVNRGPAAARNTAFASVTTDFVAFLDSDAVAPPHWPAALMHHFDDPRVGAVAPRLVPLDNEVGVLARYEAVRSSLDMGPHAELVRPGASLGFVPTAALVLRRSAFEGPPFDERLRLGEDVDLVWRLDQGGWLIRYDPSVLVGHTSRLVPREWVRRLHEYGTSAAPLAARHPGSLAPARVSAWNLLVLGLLASRSPIPALLVGVGTAIALRRSISDLPKSELLAGRIVAQGIAADAVGIGSLLRR